MSSSSSNPSHPGAPPPVPVASTSTPSTSPSAATLNHPPPPSEEVAAIDTRLHLDQRSNKWAYEDEDGNQWEWSNKAWIPVLNEDFVRAQQQAYNREGVDDEEPVEAIQRRLAKKRKTSPDPPSKPSKVQKPRPITSIFVSGLPLDCEVSEIASVFSRYGLLNQDDSGNPRIKLYRDESTGLLKGEALVTYFKPESVELAIKVLDGSCLRAGLGQSLPEMKVGKAEWKKEDGGAEGKGKEGGNGKGKEKDNEVAEKPKGKKILTDQEKRKFQKRMARMQGKLEDWNSDSDSESQKGASTSTSIDLKAKTVILSRMFTLAELEQEPELLLDLKEDVREECETFGNVSVVKIWDKEPEGIMTVRFTDSSAARACVQKMQGRFFASRTIQAVLTSSKPKFRSSNAPTGDQEEDDEEEDRKEAFGDWLESGGGD